MQIDLILLVTIGLLLLALAAAVTYILATRQRRMATDDPIQDLKATCEEIAKAEPSDIRKIASLHSKMILSYYQDVRRQAAIPGIL